FAQLSREFERLDSFRPTPVMSLSDILQIKNEHEIGVHSWEHATIAVESQEYLVGDAARCRTWLQQTVGIEPHIYAFPNGAASHGQAQMVRRAGFRHVLSSPRTFRAAMLGFIHASQCTLRRPPKRGFALQVQCLRRVRV